MVWYVAVKDIINFYRTEKHVFIWLIISMIVCSFVINYSYAFARYRGNLYDENMGENLPVYKIFSSDNIDFSTLENIFSDFENENISDVTAVSCMTNTKNGIRIVGSTELSPNNFKLTGAWVEGYASKIDSEQQNTCIVNESLLSYDGRLKMTGETYSIDGEDFVIGGVYESLNNTADLVIFLDKFKEKYKCFDEIWITFEEQLNSEQQQRMESVIKKYIEHRNIVFPEKTSETAQMITLSNQMQYSIFIVLLVTFLASIIQYWYDVNISTYTIYWITGASIKNILCVVLGETFILCTSSYIIGLLLNAISRQIVTKNAPLTVNDVVLGFSVFFGTMLVFGIINMIRICRTFSVNNIRRE